MSGALEGTADMIGAGLMGHAVEPRAGGASHGAEGAHAGDGACANCGTALIGEFCHACGQSGHVHRSIGAIGHEIAHGVFHFEGKIWRTLPLLALRPGELTRRYGAGERARFVSPLAIFLFSVFLMFAIVANLPGWHFAEGDFLKPAVAERLSETREKVAEDRGRVEGEIRDLQRRLAKERASAEPDAERVTGLSQRISRRLQTRKELLAVERALPARDAAGEGASAAQADENWFETKFRHARENPKLVLYKMKTSAYKYSWALIPLSVPFLWLLFPFSRRFALYDHAIFVTYSLSFMSLLVIVLAVLGAIGVETWLLSTAASIIPVIHIYRQLKGAYGLGRVGALVRTALLLSFICVIIVIFSLGLVYLGVAD